MANLKQHFNAPKAGQQTERFLFLTIQTNSTILELIMDKLLTTSQAAKILRIARMTLIHKLRRGEIRGIRVGGRNDWRINANDVYDFINKHMEYKIGQTS